MFNALPAPEPYLPVRRELVQKRLDYRGLANPRLAGDEDDLAFTAQGFV
jgi:hypothetical protein